MSKPRVTQTKIVPIVEGGLTDVKVAQQYIIMPTVPLPADANIAQQFIALTTVPPPSEARIAQQYIIVMIKNKKPRTRPQVYG